jgi:hypothetical protein
MAAHRQGKYYLFLILTLCLSGAARAQSGGSSIKISGGVSETVALSLPQEAGASGDSVRVASNCSPGGTLAVTLSGDARGLTEVRVPLQIRSNTGYRLSVAAKDSGANLLSLLVVDARPTGKLVSADAVEALGVSGMFDGRGGGEKRVAGGGRGGTNLYPSMELLSGPRVSLGGTLESPQNAVEVTLSLTVEPRANSQSWTLDLLFSASPDQ